MKITIQYLAGLIDGEGYMALIPSRTKELVSPSFEPVIKIGMTGEESKQIFLLLKDIYGGHLERRNVLTKGNRIAYTYTLKSRRKVKRLLSDIYPHLIIKQSQARLLLEFCDIPTTNSRYFSFDKSALARKVAIYSELKALKLPEPLATTN